MLGLLSALRELHYHTIDLDWHGLRPAYLWERPRLTDEQMARRSEADRRREDEEYHARNGSAMHMFRFEVRPDEIAWAILEGMENRADKIIDLVDVLVIGHRVK